MQNLLLTIAGAIILAVAAAFAAPLVIDWTQWRSTFEAQATRIVGAPVVIGGAIEAHILPAPRITLHDVTIGVDGVGTGLRAGALSGRFSLGALMRGDLVAEQVDLIRPKLTLMLDDAGRVIMPTGAGQPKNISIAALGIADGTLELRDRASGRAITLDHIDLAGDLAGLAGPLRLEGQMASGGVARKVRLSLAEQPGTGTGAARLRLSVEEIGNPLVVDADGVFSLAGGKPVFEGRASLTHGGGSQAPALRGADDKTADSGARSLLGGWSLAGRVKVTAQSVDADDLSLSLGLSNHAVELSGNAHYVASGQTDSSAGATGSRLQLALAARQIDLNAATGNAPPLAALDGFARTVAPLARLADAGSLDLSSDTVLIGNAAMREVRAGLDWTPAGWRARTMEARLPGRASVKLSGRLPQAGKAGAPAVGTPAGDVDPAVFAGSVVLIAEDLPAFAGWAAPDATALLAGLPPGAARLEADIALGGDRIALDRINASMGTVRLSGTGAYAFPGAQGRGRLDAALATEQLDLDPLLPPLRRLLGFGGERFDLALSFSGKAVRLAGVTAAGADIALRSDADGISIERLSVADLAGLNLTGSGRLAAPGAATADTDGRFKAHLSGTRADGLPALAQALGVAPVSSFATTMGPLLAPLDVDFTVDSRAGRTTLAASGRLGGLEGDASAAFGADRPLDARLALDVADGSAVLGRLGVPSLRANLGAARLDATLGASFEGRLAFAGASLAGTGTLEWGADGRLVPDLALKLNGADLAGLFAAFDGHAGGALPMAMTGTLARQDASWRVDRLAGTVGGQRLEGRVSYTPGLPQPYDAALSMERFSLPAALALVTGRPADEARGAGPWPDGRFGPALLADLPATLALDVGTFDLPGGLSLDSARVKARLGEGGVAVEDISGRLAGGQLAGRFTLRRRGEVAQLDGRVSLTDADGVRLLQAAGVAQPDVRGRLTVSLDATGSGRSPRALAASLQGQGSVVVDGLEIAYTDPRALQYVMLATETGMPPDQARMVQLLNEGLSRGPLRFNRVESALSLVNGAARSATARLALGDQRFALTASFDIAAFSFETTLEIEEAASDSAAAAPAAGVQWRGPITAPERRFDITGLSAAINLRVLERERKRLEAEYGRTPLTDAGRSTDAATSDAPRSDAPIPEAPTPAASAPQQTPARPAPATRPAQPAPRSAPARPAPAPQTSAPQTPPFAMPQYPQPGSAAPPLPPPVDIPPDPLRSTIMMPPLAP
ncbi:AsmA-like C-terminal region-containing protein [Ancylobacter pratisalsi]|uniref:AsmA family protein n=1 Tax=Ancylobacter pratisalsi TaxID=1745854 RepID=A0A6P1YMH5_9HYPH|nr:AsmA-like C-terminal region-containing protein [Ancylobacter pratisalsi]QIB33433.1 AsmA family protein [Ancylobacter pratisalsi]